MRTVIVADSRGRRLQEAILLTKYEGDILVQANSGADIQEATAHTLSKLIDFKPDHVVVMAGICNITVRNKVNKTTCLRYGTIAETVSNVIEQAHSAYKMILSQCDCIVSFATITGIDLCDYNNRERKYMPDDAYATYNAKKTQHPEQARLDETILMVNRRLTDLNVQHSAPTVWLASGVHAYYGHKYHHRYGRLRDGCHPTTKTLDYWARQISRTSKQLKL